MEQYHDGFDAYWNGAAFNECESDEWQNGYLDAFDIGTAHPERH